MATRRAPSPPANRKTATPVLPVPAISPTPARSRSPPPHPRPDLRGCWPLAPTPAPTDRAIAEALTQCVDRRLGGGAAGRLGIRQVAAVGLRHRQQRVGADADQPECCAGCL